MPPKDMPKEVSIMGGCPVPPMCSELLFLAEVEAEGKAKKARLRAQQRGRVAKGKKGRLGAALRHLRGKTITAWTCSTWEDLCRHTLRPYRGRAICGTALSRQRPERKGKSRGVVRQLPPEEKKG